MRKFSTTQTSNNFMFILKHCSFLSIKSFQFSLNNKEGSENNESSFNYNKVNAPNICFDKNISKEIEESVKKIISDYNENNNNQSKHMYTENLLLKKKFLEALEANKNSKKHFQVV